MGNIIALWPLDPSRMTPKRENDLLVYKYNVADTGEMITFPFWEILHVAGLSFNGLIGYSVIGLMRETIGRGLAQEEYQSRFYSQGANPSGILETDGTLGDEALEDLRKWFNATYGGISKSQQVMILQQGLKFHALTIPQRDAQFLETHKFTVRDVARWFLIPPHMIGDLERATWGNIESQSIDFVVYTLRPWLVRFEQAMEVKFNLGESYEIRHVVEGLLRGDSTARTALYNGAITSGWMNRNEVRELEDRNPVEGLDEFLTPSRAVSTSRDGGNGNGEDKDLQKKLYEMLGRANRELGDIRKHLNLVERKV
jgi:HK97 family phage portal protein